MIDIRNRSGMTDSVLESSPQLDCRVSAGDPKSPPPKMDDSLNGSVDEVAADDPDLEEGEISDEEEGAEAPPEGETLAADEATKADEPATTPTPEGKDTHKSRPDRDRRDGKRERGDRKNRDERREERREKRRREDDGRDRSRKRRRDSRDDKADKKVDHTNGEVQEEDEEMLFVRGASPSRPHSQSGGDNHESNPSGADDQNASPNSRGGRKRDERPRRRSRSRSKTRRDERPRDRRDRDRERADRGRDMAPNRERDNRERKPEIRNKSTELCMQFMEGRCKKGDDCRYVHSGPGGNFTIPMRKMELCKFYMVDCCAKKDKCLYMHKDFPCKYYHTGAKRCKAGEKQCKFSHAPLTDVTRVILRRHLETAPKDILGDFNRSKRDEALHNLEDVPHPHSHPSKKGHIPSIFELNVRAPPGLEHVTFRDMEELDEQEEEDGADRDHSFSYTHAPDDDDDEVGLQIDLGDATKVEEENPPKLVAPSENPIPQTEAGDAGSSTPVPDNEYSSEDDGPKSIADVVKKISETPETPSSLPSIPLPNQLSQTPDKVNLAAALQSLSAEQLTEMLEMVKNKGKPQEIKKQQGPLPAPVHPADPRKRVQPGQEPAGGLSPGLTPSLPARDPRLTRDPRARADPRLKATAPAIPASLLAPPPVKTNPFGTLTIPAKPEAKPVDVDLRAPFVLPPLAPLTLSDKDYRQSDVDMRSMLGKAPVNPFSNDVDLRQLPDPLSMFPFKPAPMHPPAREIDASLTSHPPIEWKVVAFIPPKPDYSHVKFNPADSSARLDPRLQRYFRKEIEESVPLPGIASPPVYNPALENAQVPVYDPRADLKGPEGYSPRSDPRSRR